MALGELIGEESGSVSAFRVVKEGFGVKVETMFEGHGQILGADVIDYATYWSIYRPDGNFTGGANGVVFTPEAEAAAYEGTGVGHMTGEGGAAPGRGADNKINAAPALAPQKTKARHVELE
jgi:hypothetical protein